MKPGYPQKPTKIVRDTPAKDFNLDAVVKLTVFLPNKEPFEDTLTLKNFIGNTIGSQRDPEQFMIMLRQSIEDKFGKIVK